MDITLKQLITHPFFVFTVFVFLGIIAFLSIRWGDREKELWAEIVRWKSVAEALKDKGTPRIEHYHHSEAQPLVDDD